MFAVSFELQLDQRQKMSRRGGDRQHSRQHKLERNETDIDHDDIRPYFKPFARERADVGLFHRDNTGIAMQARMQLPAPNIDGVDKAGTVGEQDFGEATSQAPTSTQT